LTNKNTLKQHSQRSWVYPANGLIPLECFRFRVIAKTDKNHRKKIKKMPRNTCIDPFLPVL